MEQRNLHDWLDYWLTEHGKQEIDLGLARVNQVKDRMGWKLLQPIVIVGGTNGKGSTCAFLTSIYQQAGYKVGTFTSPHILKFNERISINGIPVSDAMIISSFEKIQIKRKNISLTYFEVNTLAAVDIFLKENVDIIILEVGLGGRLDAVNIFDADVAIVTNVDLDHQEYLGDNREKIGYEKAGIFRAHMPAIFGDIAPPESLQQYIHSIGAVYFQYGSDYAYKKFTQQWSFYFQPQNKDYPPHKRLALPFPSLRGSYQFKNASAALCAIECLNHRLPVDLGSIKRGLHLVFHPARFQVLPGKPIIVLDVGHNPHAIRELKLNCHLLPFAKKKIAVFSMLRDKDMDGVIEILKEEFDEWYIATLGSDRAMSCDKIERKLLDHGVQSIKKFNSIKDAYKSALEIATEEDRIIVFGSFFTISEVIRRV